MIKSVPQTVLPLELSKEQIDRLTGLNLTLGERLEKLGTLRPEMLQDLTAAMKGTLATQPDFPGIAEEVRNRQQIVHLTHADPNILNLPWRLATEDLPLLYLTKGKPATADLPLLQADNPPLKILVMISSPEDGTWESRLSYEEEEDQIMAAFEPLFDLGQVQVDFTDDGSLENLEEKLAANQYHILHFSGHGIYRDGVGYLALEDHLTMNKRMVTAADFAATFQKKPEHMPALVVLSSCQTAQGQLEQGMQSVADELLLKEVPAVVAMSVSVTDYFATYFASALYQQLASKEPLHRAFREAIARTRQHESERYPQILPSQWMIPQLFVSRRVDRPVDWAKADDTLQFAAYKFVSGKVGLQTQKREGYRFVGRRRDRKRIFPSLNTSNSVLLKGQGGVGKTAMAEYIVQRLVAKDQRVRPFIFNETNANLNTVLSELRKFLEERDLEDVVFEAEDKYGDNAFKEFRYLFSKVKKECSPVFIFDNLETFQSGPGKVLKDTHSDLKEVLDFFYQKQMPLILTCRYAVAECPDIPDFDLNQVSRNDFLKKALQLALKDLPKKIRQKNLAHLLEERLTFRDVIGWLHETFGGNYRALEFFDEIFANKKDKLPEALKTLADFKKTYAKDTEATRQKMSKNLLFEELLQLLDEEEKHTLRLLTRFRIPVLVTALQMQRPGLAYAQLLDTLLELTLIERHPDLEHPELVYHYVTPLVKDLVNNAFAETIDFSPEQAGRYHRAVHKEVNLRNYNDLEEAFYFFVEAKNGAALNEVGSRLCGFYYNSSQFQTCLQFGLQVYELNQEETSWSILNRIGQVCDIFGKGDQALFFYQICQTKAEAENNLENKGTTLNNISQIYDARGDYETALKYLEDSLAISRQIGDKEGEGTTLNNFGLVYHKRGSYEKALEHYEQSLLIRRQIGDKSGEGWTLNNISQIYDARGDYEAALKYLEDSLVIMRQIGDKQGEGMTLNNIATTAHARGDYEAALKYLEDSLAISRQIGDKSGEGVTLNNISQIFKARGDYETALKYLEDSLEIRRQIGDKSGESTTLNNISQIYDARGDYETALRYLEDSLLISRRIGDKSGEGTTLNNISQIYDARGDYETALKYLEDSLAIIRQIGDKQVEGTTLNNISRIYDARGDYERALKYLEDSLLIRRQIGDKSGEAYTLHNMAAIAKQNGDIEKYMEYEVKSYQMVSEIGDGYATSVIGAELGIFLCQNEQIEQGLQLLEKSLSISQSSGLPNVDQIASIISHFKSQQNG